MPNTILHKRSSTPGAVPTTAALTPGEIALNTADGRAFMERINGVIVEFLTSQHFGVANGVATLGSDGRLTPAQAPTLPGESLTRRYFFAQL